VEQMQETGGRHAVGYLVSQPDPLCTRELVPFFHKPWAAVLAAMSQSSTPERKIGEEDI